ncbi:unnamed protein product [Coregonus sp. 'balchen']|nr:unnamed protein product [Coregonus sp. 'balchen']
MWDADEAESLTVPVGLQLHTLTPGVAAISAAAAPSPVMGNMPPNDGMPGGPMPPGFFQSSSPESEDWAGGRGSPPQPQDSPNLYLAGQDSDQAPAAKERGGRRERSVEGGREGLWKEDHKACVLASGPDLRFSLRTTISPVPEILMVGEDEKRRCCWYLCSCCCLGPPGSQPSPHAQPPPHNPNNPMMGPHGQPFMSPRYPGGPRPSLRMPNQPPVGVPGSQPLLPNSLDPTRPQGHPNMGGPMRMNPPRGMGGMGPQNYGGGMRPPPNSMGPGMPGMNMGPGGRGWPNPNANSGVEAHQELPSCLAQEFPMGPGPDGPMGGMGSMEPHHMNGSLGSGDMDGLPKNSPNNMAGMNNPPGTPRDDGEMAGNFLNPFQSESPPGMSLERRTPIKITHPSVCKVGLQIRKQSQSHRKSQLSDSPCLPGFLTGPGQ